MRLRERTSGRGPRCPYCREALGDAAAPACDGCGVRVHAACAGELRRCPTLGCADHPLEPATTEVDGLEAPRVPDPADRALAPGEVVTLGLYALFFVGLASSLPALSPVSALAIAAALLAAALKAALWRRGRPRLAARVLVAPPGRVIVTCTPALLRRVRRRGARHLRVELERAGDPEAAWRDFRLVRLSPERHALAVSFDPPPAKAPRVQWRVRLHDDVDPRAEEFLLEPA